MPTLQEILNRVVTNTNKIFKAEAASIALLDPSRKEIVIRAAIGEGAREVQGMSLPVGKGVVGWVILHETSAIVPDVRQDERFYPDVDEQIGFTTHSIMCSPLQIEGHIMGVIELINIHDDYLNDEGLTILNMFAEHAALAIENTNLLTETLKWSEQQALLVESRVEVNPNRALENILTMVGNQILDVLGADLCIISRRDKNSLHVLRSYVRPNRPQQEQFIRSLSTSPLGWVLNTQSMLIIERKTLALPENARQWLDLLGMQTLLLIPMSYHRQVLGLVEIGCNYSADKLTRDKLRLAETVVAQATAAIEHARLYDETTRRLAETTVLQEVMKVSASSLNFDDVLRDTIIALNQTLGLEYLAVFLPHPYTENFIVHPSAIGFDPQITVPLTHPHITKVLHDGQAVLLNRVMEDVPGFINDTQAAMYLPIIVNKTVEAILAVESVRFNAFGQTDLHMFSAIAAELGVALKNANLYETERRLAKQRQAMLDIFVDLSTELKLDVLFQRIIKRAVQVIPHADAGSLIIPAGDRFVYAAAEGFDLSTLQKFSFAHDDFAEDIPPPQVVWRLSQSELIAMSERNMVPTIGIQQDFTRHGPSKVKCTIQAGLYVGDTVLGLLSIDSQSSASAFAVEDEQTLLIFANQAAIALHNARLFDETRGAEANYRDLFDNANDLILTLDNNFCLTSANKVVLKTTGYSWLELKGQHILTFVDGRYRSLMYTFLKQRLAQPQRTSSFEVMVIGKDDQTMLIEANIRVRRKNDRLDGIHCIARNITERRALEQELQQREKLSAIGKLVAGVAHELNNPLTTVIGYASLLQEHELSPQFQTDIESIFRHAQRARAIVRDLLTFARRVQINKRPLNINQVIRTSLAEIHPTLQTHQIEIITQFDDELPQIMGDAHQLGQVCINLLNNATQALQNRATDRHIRLTTELQNQHVRITIVDNGRGIPKEDLNRIFEPFFSTKQMGHGTGLGLSICFGIISEHKGRIWAENNIDGGAAFYIELPLTEGLTTTEIPNRQRLKTAPPVTTATKPLMILTVDDEPLVLDLLQRILTTHGHTVDTASDGRTALKQLTQKTYDLVICDVVMPHLSGIEFYKQAISQYPYLTKQFIFITGNASDKQTKAFLDSSGLQWIIKPFLPMELEEAVANYANGH